MLIYEVLRSIGRIEFQEPKCSCSELYNKDGETASEGLERRPTSHIQMNSCWSHKLHAKRTKIATSFTSLLFSPSVKGITELEYSPLLISGT